MKRALPILVLIVCFDSGRVIADDESCVAVPIEGVEWVRWHQDGGAADASIIYDNITPGAFFTINNTPRWHCGEPASFAPGPAAGLTNILATAMVVTIGNNSGSAQVSDIHVKFWNSYNTAPGAGNPVNADPLQEFTLADPTPLDTGFARFYFVDLSGLSGGGILLPDDEWFIELHYFVPGTTDPQLLVSPVFNAGPDTNGDGTPDGPTVGSSGDFFFRDGNGNGVLSRTSPNERGAFVNNPNLANFAIQISANVCEPCDANCDGSVNTFDITPFINTITTHSGCSACAGDTNGNGTANAFDISGFVACLAG